MKKICFITTVPSTIKAFVLKTAEYIHENTDWDISVICSTDDAFAKMLPEYIHYYPVPMERGISIAGVKAMLEMKKIFSREKFDLIQYSTPNASLYAAMAGFFAGIPVRLYCQWGMVFVGFKGIKRWIFKQEERFVCSLSTWVEPDSKSNLAFAHQQRLYPEKKGSVIWNGSACGVDLTKFDHTRREEYRKAMRAELGIPEDAFVFGFVGRVRTDKGVNELFQAYRKICNDTKNAYLLMVGRNEADNAIDQEAYEWAQQSANVFFPGSTDKVEQYLAAMDCYVLPSYREGFGMSVVEAEAMGLPVIVTNIPGPIDGMRNRETGIIVPVKNVPELHAAMHELMTHPDLAQKYGQAGVAFVREHFDQKELHRRILEDRKKLLNV